MNNKEKAFTRRDYEEALDSFKNTSIRDFCGSILTCVGILKEEGQEKTVEAIKQALQDKIASFEEGE